MESICSRLLAHCLEGSNWSAGLIDEIRGGLASDDGSRVFFREVIEPLGDRFEPFLCDAYARLLTDILGQPELLGRYRRIREPRAVEQRDPRAVYVLSRITLGADVAVTSVLLDAAKTAFPEARIVLVGPRKNWELFEDDSRIEHRDFAYARSAGFASRMAAKPWIEDSEGIVLDPDSRLSQLGLLPVTPGDGNYYFFESRSYKAESTASLPELASQWCLETLGCPGRAFVNPKAVDERIPRARVTVNLGVGENPSKRLADPFEQQLLAALPDDTLIDLGGSELEARRVRNAAGAAKRMFQGSFADFSWLISQSRLYVGYDSAGMHVAAAGATPLVCVFAGAVSERFFWRWRPTGQGPIDIVRPGPGALEEALQAIGQRLASG